jgi:hypothetical protein
MHWALLRSRQLGKNFLTLLQHWSDAVTCPACLCGTDGRWPRFGPNRKHALESALTRLGFMANWI